MNSPLRIGLVGIGGYGRRHLSTLASLQIGGLCRLEAVADPFAARFGETEAALRSRGVELFEDIADLLAREDIEACVIATPIPLHAPQALAALNAGKHVYLEKPPCVTLDEWAQLREAQKRSGKWCTVGFQMQATPAMRFLKEQLVSGAIGKLQTISASVRWRRADHYYNRAGWAGKWTHGGRPVFDGPATNALAHVVHAALFLSGEEQRAWGEVQRVRGSLKKARPIESYDTAFLEAETRSGVLVRLAFSHATREQDEVVIKCVGETGQAEIEWNGAVCMARNGAEAESYQFHCESHFAAMLDFLRALRGPAEDGAPHRPRTVIEDCLPYLQMVNGALQSSGGAAAFDGVQVQCNEAGNSSAHYTVSGLDKELAAFAADPEAVPPSLAPSDWLSAGALETGLALKISSELRQ